MTDLNTLKYEFKKNLNRETAQIPWRELERFFASGLAIRVADELDIIDVALMMSEDEADQVSKLMASGKVGLVADQDAVQWYEESATVWALVIKPWVLVQYVECSDK